MLVLLTLAIRYAEPVRDGDLWWQMAYGRHLIENRTLIPDHTAFTWTPTESPTIYCAWLSEILLYLLYRVGDLPLLFAFRYLCLLIFVLAVWLQARRLGVASHPLTWLICLLGVLMSQSAAFIKPEIFSYVLMTLTRARLVAHQVFRREGLASLLSLSCPDASLGEQPRRFHIWGCFSLRDGSSVRP